MDCSGILLTFSLRPQVFGNTTFCEVSLRQALFADILNVFIDVRMNRHISIFKMASADVGSDNSASARDAES
jgi:hypothetical protein